MAAADELATIGFESQRQWADWLARHHAESKGIWMKIAKKGGDRQSVTYPEAVEEALCYGWIDGQKRQLDEQFWLQKFTPRGKRSVWSKINRDKALELIANGRMQPAGEREVERAKADGRWDNAYAGQKTATVPDDLLQALSKTPKAKAFFEKLNSVNRYAILFRLQTAKREETRQKRIQQFVEMLSEERTLYP
jgi:uncharacterized protein YdeI (YjbR/CyaY-like superfamily)